MNKSLGQLSLPSFQGRSTKYWPVWLGLTRGVAVSWGSINDYTLPLHFYLLLTLKLSVGIADVQVALVWAVLSVGLCG